MTKKLLRYGTKKGWCLSVKGDESIAHFVDMVNSEVRAKRISIAVVGDEIGANGIRHAQAFLNFSQGRGITQRQLIKFCKSHGVEHRDMHVEPRCGPVAAAGNYCLKEHYAHIAALFPDKGTVDELYRPNSQALVVVGWDIDAAAPLGDESRGARVDLNSFKFAVQQGLCPDYATALEDFSNLCIRAERFVKDYIRTNAPKLAMSVDEWRASLSAGWVRRWQASLIEKLANEDVEYRYRKVHVITDCVLNGGRGGKSGKSHFCDWFPRLMLNVGQKVQVLAPGKLADMAMQLEDDTDIVLIDIPASRSDCLQWSFVEQLKDGLVTSPKYQSRSIRMINKPIRVVILCNQHPDIRRRSDYVEYTNDNGLPIDGYGRPLEDEFTLSKDRFADYDIDCKGDLAPVHDFRLPKSMGFGPEFNSDNSGDGPVKLFLPEFWREFELQWESTVDPEDRSNWIVDMIQHGWHDENSLCYNRIHDEFLAHGWDGTGSLEVNLGWRNDYFRIYGHNFLVRCLEKGLVDIASPKGVVLVDFAGRVARCHFDIGGGVKSITAVDPRALEPGYNHYRLMYMVRAYCISREWTCCMSNLTLNDFLCQECMNGDYSPKDRDSSLVSIYMYRI